MAGETAERQENGIVKGVAAAVKTNKGSPVTLVAGKTIIPGVIAATKFTGRQLGGSEPYTDIVLTLHNKKTFNLSCKGETAPSLAGGGMTGIELAVPGIAKKFMKAAHSHLMTKLKLAPGSKVPDVYGKISGADKLKIVVGNTKMAGPIDYMYIGKMDVKAVYDKKTNTVTFNASMTKAVDYANTHDLYFRLRARREDQPFDPITKDKNGTPKIYGKSPSKGDSAGRIMVTDQIPVNAVIVKL